MCHFTPVSLTEDLARQSLRKLHKVCDYIGTFDTTDYMGRVIR